MSKMLQLKYAYTFIVSKLDVFFKLLGYYGNIVTRNRDSYNSLDYGTSLITVFKNLTASIKHLGDYQDSNMGEPFIDNVHDYGIKMHYIEKYSLCECVDLCSEYKEPKQVRLYESEYVTGVLDWLKDFGAIVLGVHVIKNCEKSLELCIEDKHVLGGIQTLSILNIEFGASLDCIRKIKIRPIQVFVNVGVIQQLWGYLTILAIY